MHNKKHQKYTSTVNRCNPL